MSWCEFWKYFRTMVSSFASDPTEIELPSGRFWAIAGRGEIGSEDFQHSLTQLRSALNLGAHENPDAPWEVEWSLDQGVSWTISDKGPWKSLVLAAIPGELSDSDAGQIANRIGARVISRPAERCLQIFHCGPAEGLSDTLKKLDQFRKRQGLARTGRSHREIYLSERGDTFDRDSQRLIRYPVREDYSCV